MRKQHGMRHTKTYKAWASMIQRCRSPKSSGFKNYGGRGISVCDRWLDFRNFFEDMGVCPDGLSLDRIDVNGNYAPGNCRWVDRKTQARNTRLRAVNKSGINGVWWYADRNAWVVKIHHNGKVVHLRQTTDFFEACCARRSAELTFRKGT